MCQTLYLLLTYTLRLCPVVQAKRDGSKPCPFGFGVSAQGRVQPTQLHLLRPRPLPPTPPAGVHRLKLVVGVPRQVPLGEQRPVPLLDPPPVVGHPRIPLWTVGLPQDPTPNEPRLEARSSSPGPVGTVGTGCRDQGTGSRRDGRDLGRRRSAGVALPTSYLSPDERVW